MQFEKNVYNGDSSSLVAILELIAANKSLLDLFIQDFVERVMGYSGLSPTWKSLLVEVGGRLYDASSSTRPTSYLLHWFAVNEVDRNYVRFLMNCVSPLQVSIHPISHSFTFPLIHQPKPNNSKIDYL